MDSFVLNPRPRGQVRFSANEFTLDEFEICPLAVQLTRPRDRARACRCSIVAPPFAGSAQPLSVRSRPRRISSSSSVSPLSATPWLVDAPVLAGASDHPYRSSGLGLYRYRINQREDGFPLLLVEVVPVRTDASQPLVELACVGPADRSMETVFEADLPRAWLEHVRDARRGHADLARKIFLVEAEIIHRLTDADLPIVVDGV